MIAYAIRRPFRLVGSAHRIKVTQVGVQRADSDQSKIPAWTVMYFRPNVSSSERPHFLRADGCQENWTVRKTRTRRGLRSSDRGRLRSLSAWACKTARTWYPPCVAVCGKPHNARCDAHLAAGMGCACRGRRVMVSTSRDCGSLRMLSPHFSRIDWHGCSHGNPRTGWAPR